MCSNFEEPDIFNLPINKRDNSLRKCMKCLQENTAVVVIRENDSMCRDCFLSYCVHKFRSSFGKTRVVRDNDVVLVSYTGGLNSTVLLHLIEEGKSTRAKKKLRFEPIFVLIDEGKALDLSYQQRISDLNARIKDFRKLTNRRFLIFALEQVFSESNLIPIIDLPEIADQSDCLTQCNSLKNEEIDKSLSQVLVHNEFGCKLLLLLESLSTCTAKESLIRTLRKNLLFKVAEQFQTSKILMGDNAGQIATRILSDITQGRGSGLSSEIGFCDKRHLDIMVLRPMREFIPKEVALYSALNNLDSNAQTKITTLSPVNVSINKITENFVAELQSHSTMTIPKILRTGEKFSSNPAAEESNGDQFICLLCHNMANVISNSKLSAESDLLNTLKEESFPSLKNKEKSFFFKLKNFSFAENLCYGCRLIVMDMSKTDYLEEYIKSFNRKSFKLNSEKN